MFSNSRCCSFSPKVKSLIRLTAGTTISTLLGIVFDLSIFYADFSPPLPNLTQRLIGALGGFAIGATGIVATGVSTIIYYSKDIRQTSISNSENGEIPEITQQFIRGTDLNS